MVEVVVVAWLVVRVWCLLTWNDARKRIDRQNEALDQELNSSHHAFVQDFQSSVLRSPAAGTSRGTRTEIASHAHSDSTAAEIPSTEATAGDWNTGVVSGMKVSLGCASSEASPEHRSRRFMTTIA